MPRQPGPHYNANRFERRSDFWGHRNRLFGYIEPSIQGAHRWHSYNWYLKQLYLSRYPRYRRGRYRDL
jgi:hypothetical protein